MRLDKYLKLSRLIKRRTLAKEASLLELIYVNDVISKPSKEVKINDIITLNLGYKIIKVKVESLDPKLEMFTLISEIKK